MSLYPTTSLSASSAAIGSNVIAPGNLIYIPMVMASNATKITLIQDSTAQDYSLRVWVSLVPVGPAITPYITLTSSGKTTNQSYLSTWHAFKDTSNPFVLFTATAGFGTAANFSSAVGVFYVLVPDSTCYINVLNLTNTANSFTFAQGSP